MELLRYALSLTYPERLLMLKIIGELRPPKELPTPKLDLTLAIPTETGYELPTTGLAKILPPPPTYECPICYETGESHFQCPNGHTAACLPCLQHIYDCPMCRLPIRDEFMETANETDDEYESDHERDDSEEFNPMTNHRDLADESFTLTIDDTEGQHHEFTLEFCGSSNLRTSFTVREGTDLTSAPFFTLTKNHSFWMEIFNSNGGEKRYSLTQGERNRLMTLYLNRCVNDYAGLHFTPARGPVLIKGDYY